VKNSSPPQRGWHICRKGLAGIRTPAGCYIPPFPSANLFQGCSILLMQKNIAPRWGAAAATRASTNMPPRWGGEDSFLSVARRRYIDRGIGQFHERDATFRTLQRLTGKRARPPDQRLSHSCSHPTQDTRLLWQLRRRWPSF